MSRLPPARAWRLPGLALAATLAGVAAPRSSAAQAVAPSTIDRDAVMTLARRSWSVRVAEARVGEARALHEGASLPARDNPSLQLRAGPRWTADRGAIADVSVTLSWPVDLSGSSGARVRHADVATEAAEATVRDAARVALGDALDHYARCLGAAEFVRLAEARVGVDEALVRAVGVRRGLGATGDADVAMAGTVLADSTARLHRARGELSALRAELMVTLGLDPRSPAEVAGSLGPPEGAVDLDALVARTARRTDVLAAAASVQAARAEAEVQRRGAIPVPRLTLQGLRENELYVQGGVELSLPVFQRNQTARAVLAATAATRATQESAARARAEGEVVAAWRRSEGARAAFEALDASTRAVDDTERLATRAYELGGSDLSSVMVVRRTVMDARAARVEALLAWVRARVALDAAAGVEP